MNADLRARVIEAIENAMMTSEKTKVIDVAEEILDAIAPFAAVVPMEATEDANQAGRRQIWAPYIVAQDPKLYASTMGAAYREAVAAANITNR